MLSYASDQTTTQQRTGRALQLARFVAALAWSVSSRLLSDSSARGIAYRFHMEAVRPLLSALFFLFLLAVGFSLLEMIARRHTTGRSVIGLPQRPTWSREWLLGAALGWGMTVLAVLPMVLTGRLYITFWTGPGIPGSLILAVLTLLVSSLTVEMIFRGYPFRCLMEAIGPVGATVGMAVLFGLTHAIVNRAPSPAIFIAIGTGILFSIAWLRTHGLWLAWGMRFAWTASMGVLFGLPVSGDTDSAILVQTNTLGPRWLTGGSYGPQAAWFTAIALVAGLIVLIRITRDYAWDYTHPPIIPGGYPLEAKPPAAHAAMEQAQQNSPPALVQILPSTPQGRSSGDPPDA